MLGFSWPEIILIGAVALVVIGPKDLPRVLRTAGQWSRKLRMLAGDFQRQFDEMVRQAELDEVRREAEKAVNIDEIKKDVENAVDAAAIERSVAFDETTAAAELPVMPPGEVPPMPPPEDIRTETIHDPALGTAAPSLEPAAPVLHEAPESLHESPAREATP